MKQGMVKDINVEKDKKQRGLDMSMSHTLSMCEDFANEVSAFKKFIHDGGDILVTSDFSKRPPRAGWRCY